MKMNSLLNSAPRYEDVGGSGGIAARRCYNRSA